MNCLRMVCSGVQCLPSLVSHQPSLLPMTGSDRRASVLRSKWGSADMNGKERNSNQPCNWEIMHTIVAESRRGPQPAVISQQTCSKNRTENEECPDVQCANYSQFEHFVFSTSLILSFRFNRIRSSLNRIVSLSVGCLEENMKHDRM